MAVKRDPRLRAFVKVDKLGQVVPGTLILRRKPPQNGTSFYWIEIESNICCSQPLSNWDYFDGSVSNDGIFLITVNGTIIVNATNTEAGTFTAGPGDTVVITSTGTGPTKSLLVVDDTTGAILSNQTGTTGALTYTYVAPGGHAYSVVATQNPTTTTTTTTTSTSTTSTTSTSTTSTSTSTTTTTSTTFAAGLLALVNGHSGPNSLTLSFFQPTAAFSGGTFPVAQGSNTTMTTTTGGTGNITVSVGTGTGIVDPATLSLYKNGALQETIGVITSSGTRTFGSISWTTGDRLEIILN